MQEGELRTRSTIFVLGAIAYALSALFIERALRVGMWALVVPALSIAFPTFVALTARMDCRYPAVVIFMFLFFGVPAFIISLAFVTFAFSTINDRTNTAWALALIGMLYIISIVAIGKYSAYRDNTRIERMQSALDAPLFHP